MEKERIGMEGMVVGVGSMSGKIPALCQQFQMVVILTSFQAVSAIHIASS